MKKRFFTLLMGLFFAVSFTVEAQNDPGEDPQLGLGRSYEAGYIGSQAVTIDAAADEAFWSQLPFAEMDNSVAGSDHDQDIDLTASDFTGQFKVAWDDSNFYIFIASVDDSVVSGAGGITSDNVEIFFNTDSLWYDRAINDSEDDHRDPYRNDKNFTASQIRVNVLNDMDITAGGYAGALGDPTNYNFTSVQTGDGFNMEIKIPFEYIMNPDAANTFSPAEGGVIHFDIGYGDVDDDSGNRQHIVHWNATNPDAWKDVRLFGRLELASPGTPSGECPTLGRGRSYQAGYIGSMTVDMDPTVVESFWSQLPFAEMDTSVAGSDHDQDIDLTASDFTGKFKVAWDDSNYYIYVSAVDDSIVSGAGGITSDNVEIFFNTDAEWCSRAINDSQDNHRDPYRNDKNFTASQIRVNVLNDMDITAGGYAGALGDPTNYDFRSVQTEDGFAMKIKVPFEYIMNPAAANTFSPAEGALLNFDIGYGDVDDDSGNRQHIVHWNATNSDAWKDVRHFGEAVLGPEIQESSVRTETMNRIRVYPSPASSILYVELDDVQKYRSICLVNILGQGMKHLSSIEETNLIPVEDLPAGVYSVVVYRKDGMISARKFIKN